MGSSTGTECSLVGLGWLTWTYLAGIKIVVSHLAYAAVSLEVTVVYPLVGVHWVGGWIVGVCSESGYTVHKTLVVTKVEVTPALSVKQVVTAWNYTAR